MIRSQRVTRNCLSAALISVALSAVAIPASVASHSRSAQPTQQVEYEACSTSLDCVAVVTFPVHGVVGGTTVLYDTTDGGQLGGATIFPAAFSPSSHSVCLAVRVSLQQTSRGR